MDKKQAFLKRILATFKMEAEENLNAMAAHLIELEKSPPEQRRAELIEMVYRVAHSLKGASRAVNLSEIESICHAFEDVMSAIRNEELEFSPQVFDILHQTVDILTETLNAEGDEVSPELDIRITEHIENLSSVEAGIEIEGMATTNIPKPEIQNPKHETQNPKHETQNSKPETSNPKPQTSNLKPETQNAKSQEQSEKSQEQPNKPETQNLRSEASPYGKPETSNLKPETSNPKPETQNPKPKIRKPKRPTFTKKVLDETIRVSTSKLDNLLFQAEEMLALKLSAAQRIGNLQNILSKLTVWKKEASDVFLATRIIKQFLQANDKEKTFLAGEKEIAAIVHFYEFANSHIQSIEKELHNLRNFSNQEAYSTGSKIETLLGDVKDLITVPFSTLLDVFPKMIRDIAKDLDKEVDFVVEGDDNEIDRRILEKLRSPLMHILRNSIDYGIERPEERIKNNKSAKGNITLKIEQLENNKVDILISDDGAGIDLKKLKQLYFKNETVADNDIDKINEKELLNYIFRSGVSTGEIVTDLSGRGLGLAIVQEAIEQLGGTIEVGTEVGKSTTFHIRLPVSIVTFRGVLLVSSGRQFVVPTSKVQRVLKLNNEEIKTIENKATIPLDGEIIPLASLSETLELPANDNTSEHVQIIVFEVKGKKIGFTIDKVIGEQELLVKKFNKQLSRVRNISGATILGSGKVVPILNISDLFKSSVVATTSSTKFADDEKSDVASMKSILVVEDSITSRTLIKNILEAAGYNVTTAIDGVEGFTKLKEGDFDAVVTDIEMPRMNGFDLTAKIRATKKTADMPIVLVTSLSKREDRERGIDVGANAYIIKSSFDQSNLLEIIERFI